MDLIKNYQSSSDEDAEKNLQHMKNDKEIIELNQKEAINKILGVDKNIVEIKKR